MRDISHPEPIIIHVHRPVPESMSRTIDMVVQAQEMPYGYAGDGPAADTGDFNQAAIESRKSYKPRGK